MAKGLFITFEGSEACGKTTQIELLAQRFREMGKTPLLTREPGGTDAGESIRDLLQFSKAGDKLTSEAELLLFTASRAQLVREVIQPALQNGQVIISDRFHDSTTVYQGVARRIDPEKVNLINRFAIGDCLPDITFIFDLDPEIAAARLADRIGAQLKLFAAEAAENDATHPKRIGAKPDRMESQPKEFYQAVRDGYLALAKSEPQRFITIDATQSIAEIAEIIWASITAQTTLP